jgi:hypothetical protein
MEDPGADYIHDRYTKLRDMYKGQDEIGGKKSKLLLMQIGCFG